MSIDKIRFPQGQSQDLWPQLPAKPAKEAPLDQYIPALNWKKQLGIDVVAQASRLTSRPIETPKDKIVEISFRLLGKDYQWTIHTPTSQVMDAEVNVIGKAHLELLYPDKQDNLKFFDVTLIDGKKEIFGYIAKDGSVPFVCLTRHTPRAEKLKIARIMQYFVSGRMSSAWQGAEYLDKVLRRLDDADMLNSFIEHLVSKLGNYRSLWAGQRLISILECSATPNSKRVELTMKLLPLAERGSSLKKAFAQAMARGLSRDFVTTMKRFLMMMLDSENKKQRLAVAYILLHTETGKPLKLRFSSDISDILDAVQPVIEDVQDEDLAQALYRIGDDSNYSLPILERLADLAAILLDTGNVEIKKRAVWIIRDICNNMKANLHLLSRCLELLKTCLNLESESYHITYALSSIAEHTKADSDLANEALKLLWLRVEEAEPKEKPDVLAMIAALINSPNAHFGRGLFLQVLKRLEILGGSSDKEVVRRVAWAFRTYSNEPKLEKEDLDRAAVMMKRLGDKHHNDDDVLQGLSRSYLWMALNLNADEETLELFYDFLAPLAGRPNVTNAIEALGYVAGNRNVSKDVFGKIMKILLDNLSHRDNKVRSFAARSFYQLRLNSNIREDLLLNITRRLFAYLANEVDEDTADSLIVGLLGISENYWAGAKLLRLILHGIIPYLEDARPDVRKRAFGLIESMARQDNLPSDLAHSLAELLQVPLLDKKKDERDKAADSLDFLIKRFPDIDEQVKKALRIHHTEGRFYREGGIDVMKIRKDLEDADPEIREEAAREARFVGLTKGVLRSGIQKIRSLPELKAIMDSLRTSSRDSDYFVQYESKVSMGIIAFVIEDKSLPAPERQPMIVVPDVSTGEVGRRSRAVRPTYKQKQHHIFRRFAIIPLNNTRRFSHRELKFIDEGLKALPYEILRGFYTVMANDLDYDRHNARGLFDRGQVKFQGREVTIAVLYHEIGHSVYKSVLTDEQRERFIELHKKSKTDVGNYATGYATHDVGEDFAETFAEWTMDSKGFLSLAIKRCQAGKPILLEKILLVAEALSAGGSFIPTYEVHGSRINRGELPITRYNDGKIKTIAVGGVTHEFEYDAKDRLFKMDGKKVW